MEDIITIYIMTIQNVLEKQNYYELNFNVLF